MRILVVSQYFWPENFRVNDLCSELAARGHEITILTAHPNYPSGKVFEEFKRHPENFDEYNGCKIIRIPIVARGENALTLIFNYLSYPIIASTYGLFKLRKQSFDVVFIFQLSPILLAIPGIIYKKIYKTPVAMWVLDLWPDTLRSVNTISGSLAYSIIFKLVKLIYKRCDLILGQSESFVRKIKQNCEDKSKVELMFNWSEDIFSNSVEVAPQKLIDNSGFNVLFAGNVGEAQDFKSILNAAVLLKQAGENVKIYIVGDGREYEFVREQIFKLELQETLIMLGRYPLADMPSFYNAADALLVTLKASEAFTMTVPGKLQSYMSAGKPIITMLDGEGSKVVKEAKCGLTNSAGDSDGLAKSILNMAMLNEAELAEFGQNAKAYSKLYFDRECIISQFETRLSSILKSDHPNLKY